MFKAHPPKTKTSSRFLLQRHPGGQRQSVHDPPRWGRAGPTGTCTPKWAPPEGETTGDWASAPTLGSKCRDLPGRPGEARGETQRWARSGGPRGRVRGDRGRQTGGGDRQKTKQKRREGQDLDRAVSGVREGPAGPWDPPVLCRYVDIPRRGGPRRGPGQGTRRLCAGVCVYGTVCLPLSGSLSLCNVWGKPSSTEYPGAIAAASSILCCAAFPSITLRVLTPSSSLD